MKKHIVIFEARGGTDKGDDGFRNDSKPIINSLRKRGWTAEIIFYSDENRGEIYRHTIEKADAYINRVNPGNLPNEKGYFQMLRELVNNGVSGFPHPDTMHIYGAKNSITKLKGTSLVPEDIFTYATFEELKNNFPKKLAEGIRVIKQNRGSTGHGVWKVEVLENEKYTDKIPLDAKLKLIEANDNHIEYKSLKKFLKFCKKYLKGEHGIILDTPFLERIIEGEIRVIMLKDKIVNIVHKKPADVPDAFSAALFSGAIYRYDKPEKWPDLVKLVTKNIPLIQEKLGGHELPLFWTADFILDTDKNTKEDVYVLDEINASCVGFTTFLELSEQIADELLNVLYAENVVNKKWAAYKN
ncbi:Cj0069 family protein [Aureivirga sp. CE67]|uniref:Cj0069 family protein n=1 Tax=Aureivirga sp. CE67 TaxID=1788983 RepID=UPI0018CAEC49|nr:Cj0069 family protein [Aureivirga sp. CE67]